MAWTAPMSWTSLNIVTAAQLNQQIRDNLRYLKGLDGAVDISNRIVATAAGNCQLQLRSSNLATAYVYVGNSSNQLLIDINRDPVSGNIDDATKSHGRIMLDGNGSESVFSIRTAAAANTFATEKMRVNGAGYLGLGTDTPATRLHAKGDGGHFLFFEGDQITTTQRLVLPSGAAGQAIFGFAVAAVSSGGYTPAFTTIQGTVGTNFTLFSNGGHVLSMNYTGGQYVVYRTAGGVAFKCSIILLAI